MPPPRHPAGPARLSLPSGPVRLCLTTANRENTAQGASMSNTLRPKKTPGKEEAARPGIPLTLPSMLAVLFLALVAISSSYLVGVMFGRSQWESSTPMSTDSSEPAAVASPMGNSVEGKRADVK